MQEFDLADDISAFIREKERLIESKSAPWALFSGGVFQRAFVDYASAVDFAVDAGMAGRFLVRNLYAEPAQAPFVFARKA